MSDRVEAVRRLGSWAERELLRRTAEIAAGFVESLDERPVWPPASVEELRARSAGRCQDEPHRRRSR